LKWDKHAEVDLPALSW